MKIMKFLFVALMGLSLATALPSCKKDKDEASCTDGIQNGNETGVDCGGDCGPCLVGVQGKWWSKGDDVAPLLKEIGFDSIYAEFNTNQTYSVVSYFKGTPINLSGVYTQSESGVNGIWNITVNQSAPSVLTSEGIFKVEGDSLKYEVIQTEPIGTVPPPTAAGGFGSSNGGTEGFKYLQKYVRVN